MSSELRGVLRHNEPMASHVSWRAGGPAAIWYQPADTADLRDFLGQCEGPRMAMGLGSNLLVRDGGYAGAIVSLYGCLDELKIGHDGQVVAGAGVHCATLAKRCADAGLQGATFLGGIPGTLGGALAMNAGAWGGETWPVVESVTCLDTDGGLHEYAAADFDWSYRQVETPLPGLIFAEAKLQLAAGGDATSLRQALREMLSERRESQPVGQPSCGSVFRNPPDNHAAALLEQAGLKGYRQGGAQFSEKHANFIVNLGGATAEDIEALIVHGQAVVREQFSVELQTEVRIVGAAA